MEQDRKNKLIGLVALECVRKELDELKDGFGMLRLDSLEPEMLAACVNTIAADPIANTATDDPNGVDIKIPRELLDASLIKRPEVLFAGNAAAARNSSTTKHLLLFANGSHDEIEDTLRQVGTIGQDRLLEDPSNWEKALQSIFPQLTPQLGAQLRVMLRAFTSVLKRNIAITEEFAYNVAESLVAGDPIKDAVNGNLWVIGLPKYADAMPRKDFDLDTAWVKTFEKLKSVPPSPFRKESRPLSLTPEVLKEHFEALRENVSEEVAEIYASLASEDGRHDWSELLTLDWERDRLSQFLSEKSMREPRLTLGAATLAHLEAGHSQVLPQTIHGLDCTVEEFLEEYDKNAKLQQTEEMRGRARVFYSFVASDLADNPALDRKWDNALFTDEIETDNFLDGVLRAALVLAERNKGTVFKDPVLCLTCQNKTMDIVKTLNEHCREYFAMMNRGLEADCGDFIAFRFANLKLTRTKGLNLLFEFEEARANLEKRYQDAKPTASVSKAALELKFQAVIAERSQLDDEKLCRNKAVRICWSQKKTGVTLGMSRDFRALSKRRTRDFSNIFKVVLGRNFKQTNNKGLISEISLEDSGSFGFTSGCFVHQNVINLIDLEARFKRILNADANAGVDAPRIRAAWEAFAEAYRKALGAFADRGLGAPEIPEMYEAWTELLRAVNDNADKSQQFRHEAYSSLLSIGTFSFVDRTSSNAVVMPWHPIRLYELHCDFVRKTGLVKVLLKREDATIVGAQDFTQALWRSAESFMPQFVVAPDHAEKGMDAVCREILAPIEHFGGYTLYSRIAGPACRDAGINAASIAELGGVAQDYGRLVPQHVNSLNVALPDAVSQAFPVAVLKDLVARFGEDELISLFVGGINATGYTQSLEEDLFQGLTLATGKTDAVAEAGISAASLKARLQFAVSRSDRAFGEQKSGAGNARPYDLTFIDRFLTYSAKQKWVPLPKTTLVSNPYGFDARLHRLSRRLVRLEDEYISRTLLCDRETDAAGRLYINATSFLLTDQSAETNDAFVYPCLEVNCSDTDIRNCIRELHESAQWVVTSNDLIDRRQLVNNKIKLVRYKQNDRTGKTVIVSSEMPTDLLTNRIKTRLEQMRLGTNEAELTKLAERILDDSFRISGYVALRSAKLDNGANEIIGLVLSDWLARTEVHRLCKKAGETVVASASFLVDDYATFFRRGTKLADLLGLVLSKKDGRLYLHIYVTESKFYHAAASAHGRRTSEAQLAATVGVLEKALIDSAEAEPERPIWLGRLANLVLSMARNDMDDPSSSSNELIDAADRIVSGNVSITINAASHVFVHDEPVTSEAEKIHTTCSQAAQYVFGSDAVSSLLQRFAREQDPTQTVDDALKVRPFEPAFLLLNLVKPWRWAYGFGSVPTSDVENESEDETEATPAEPVAPTNEKDAGSPMSVPVVIPATTEIIQIATTDMTYAPSFAALVKTKGGDFSYSAESLKWAEDATEMLRMDLVTKGVPARVISHTLTPNGCLVSFEGDERLNTKLLMGMKDGLLMTRGLNIISARPAPHRFNVLFNDPSRSRESVSIWSAWEHRPAVHRQGGINFSFMVGLKEEDGQILCLDPIEQDPHTLIAGSTGSGKTVLVQTLLLDMAATNPSNKLKFFIIDPKGGMDYAPLAKLPHLAEPVVIEQTKAVDVLNKVLEEMERRYVLFREAQAKNLQRYNAKVPPEEQLPAIFLVHDEIPNWMQDRDYAEKLTTLVTKLATTARAAGIYLILMAQRPDKDVLPMQIRDNLANRLVLKLSALSGEIALGEKGAENLLGKGHLVAKLGGVLSYAQAPYVNDENGEIEEVVDAICAADGEWR